MKASQTVLFILLILTVAGCSKMNTGSSLTGKWRLNEVLLDPGDGTSQWRPVTTTDYHYFTFDNNGTGSSSGSTSHKSYTYAILDSGKIEFNYAEGQKEVMTYTHEENTLTLSPRCAERCSFRYTRVN